jgi:hypothetical protein
MAFAKGNNYGIGNGFKKGNKLWDNPKSKATQFTKGNSGSLETQFKKGWKPTPELIAYQKAIKIGDKNPSWKGGVTPLNKKLRKSEEYKNWRKQVFKRDDYTCQGCGNMEYIQAHHIKSFANYKDLRFEITNGITLCESCHSVTDNYKGKANSKIK